MFRKNFVLLLVIPLLIQGCSPGHKNDVSPNSAPFVTYKNVLYGTDTAQQDMDVYLPQQRNVVNTPVVIIIHGGSWVQGSKADFNGLGLDTFFTSKGCAVMIINYRLDQFNKYPAQVDDIGLVMDYIKQNSATWQINPNRVCLLGRSVGSQLALIYGYSRNTDNRVKAVIDGFGPTDLTDSSVVDGPLGINVTYLLGPYVSNRQAWHDASPVFYMQGALPTVIYQGTADELVFPIQSQLLQDSLVARGVPNMLIYWQGAGHGWDQAGWEQYKDATWAWVSRFLLVVSRKS